MERAEEKREESSEEECCWAWCIAPSNSFLCRGRKGESALWWILVGSGGEGKGTSGRGRNNILVSTSGEVEIVPTASSAVVLVSAHVTARVVIV